jgi:hypothetical protein
VTDKKKPPEGAEPFDWDRALSEWDEKAFKPEVAKELPPGPAEPARPAPRPLYRPPTDLMGKAPPPRPPPPTTAPRPAAPARRSLPPPTPIASSEPPTARVYDVGDDGDGATMITSMPDVLAVAPPPPPVPRPVSRSPVPAPRTASPLPPYPSRVGLPSSAAPTRSPSPPPVVSTPTSDAAIDVALELPEVRAQQATVPAADEIDDIMRAAVGSVPPPPSAGETRGEPVSKPDPTADPPASAPEPPRSRRVHRAGDVRSWSDERPASEWLSEGARAALEGRAAWLEDEARATVDKVVRARGLLACSEILATVGDLGHAEEIATEARTIAPSVALAHRQARALLPSPPDPDDYLVALDIEAKAAPGAAARAHTTLIAADVLRGRGDDDGAGKRLDQAARLAPGDARPAVARAARALGRQDLSNAALRLPESGELGPIAEAIGTALRLRGIERKESEERAATAGELLLKARRALERADVAGAAALVAELATIPELARGATWLAASLGAVARSGRAEAARRLEALADGGVEKARRALVARGLELADPVAVARSLAGASGFSAAEMLAIGALAGLPPAGPDEVAAAGARPEMMPLVAAVGVVTTPMDAEAAPVRATYAAGTPRSRAAVRLGRLLAAGAEPHEVEKAIDALAADAPLALPAIELELSARAGNWAGVSRALEGWGAGRRSPAERAICALAAAVIAERAGDSQRATDAFGAARKSDPLSEAALRALASLSVVDLVSELNVLADDLGEGVPAAILRLEAIARAESSLPEPTRAALLERVHRAAPSIPIASFLGERMARRAGDVESALRWIRERQAHATDPIEAAIDAVREARLLMSDASEDPSLAAERLREAHQARPSDVALRELYERTAPDASDAASWRERRAAESTGAARATMYFEAALAYERAGDEEGALRSAEGAASTDAPLGIIARERAELRTGRVARLADELLSAAKGVDDTRSRREAYQRLATLDATARHDPASALLWHRSIIEESPDSKPSLRHIEQHLIGEGRDDELEPIAAAIANVLRSTGSGESSAHAELAARLRMRGAAGSWDSSYELVELAAAEREPTIWALRMRQAHARARLDDDAFVDATVRLSQRATQSSDLAALLGQAGEAALRRDRLDEARAMLDRATSEDPGDVNAWATLKEARSRAGDSTGAAEAAEALARSSLVPEHQLAAWYEAGSLWDARAEASAEGERTKSQDRAVVALEAAAAIDVAQGDVFDRLSRIYAARGMQPELASLLERRIAGISDPQARLAMEVRRGRLLLDVGDRAAARRAFESALGERPDDPDALAAFADLCVAEKDWEAVEQGLVRLARLLPTPEEQRAVYARLGDLYSGPLVNLARAEVALKEVLKRGPDDVRTMEKLVDVYKRQNDAARAAELQLELIGRAQSPEEKRARILELAAIHENTAHDNRRAEQTLETARREFPQDVGLLRALAEFYVRHHQTPAVNILLDRAGADARRALAAGRFTPASFGVIAAVSDLRGKKDAAAASAAMLAALEGRPAQLSRAGERALDARLDDVLAPDVLTTALRALLAKTGDALDVVSPVDTRALGASTVPADAPIARLAASLAVAAGIGTIHVLSSPKLGAACMPIGARPPSPPCVVVGQSMLADDRIGPFLLYRAIKLIAAKASAFARSSPSDMAVLVSAWLKCFNPTWQPQGINPALLNAAGGKLQAAMPKRLDPDIGMLALEVAGAIGTQQVTLGPNAIAWGNRVALLALGDANVALDAIAASSTPATTAPAAPAERAAWIGRTPAARELITFGVTDAFADARGRLNLR